MVLNIFQRLELLVLGGLDFKQQLLVHLSLAAATFLSLWNHYIHFNEIQYIFVILFKQVFYII